MSPVEVIGKCRCGAVLTRQGWYAHYGDHLYCLDCVPDRDDEDERDESFFEGMREAHD